MAVNVISPLFTGLQNSSAVTIPVTLSGGNIVIVSVAVQPLASRTVTVKVPSAVTLKVGELWKLTPSMLYSKGATPVAVAVNVKAVPLDVHWSTAKAGNDTVGAGSVSTVISTAVSYTHLTLPTILRV